MIGFLVQCIEKYLELAKLAKDKLKPVATPSIDDHQISPEDFEEKGDLASCATKIVMKILYGARWKSVCSRYRYEVTCESVTKREHGCVDTYESRDRLETEQTDPRLLTDSSRTWLCRHL